MGVQTKPLPQHGAQTVDAWDVPLEIVAVFEAGADLDLTVSTEWRNPPPFDPVRCLVWSGVVLIGLLTWAVIFLAVFRFVV